MSKYLVIYFPRLSVSLSFPFSFLNLLTGACPYLYFNLPEKISSPGDVEGDRLRLKIRRLGSILIQSSTVSVELRKPLHKWR